MFSSGLLLSPWLEPLPLSCRCGPSSWGTHVTGQMSPLQRGCPPGRALSKVSCLLGQHMPIPAECLLRPVATVHLAVPPTRRRAPQGWPLGLSCPLWPRTGPLLSAQGHGTPALDRPTVKTTDPLHEARPGGAAGQWREGVDRPSCSLSGFLPGLHVGILAYGSTQQARPGPGSQLGATSPACP